MAEYQYQDRREFLRYFFGAGILSLGGFRLIASEDFAKKGIMKLTILYTNDTHSRIEPFPSNDPKYPDQGGFARRAALIKKIRSEEKNVLLLDAGDIFQGTPYFNFYSGELEYKLMSAMGYDVVTLGNHDFDLGLDNLVKQMPHAHFDFVCGNYDFSDTVLNGKIAPYKIIQKDGIRIGILGLGIELEGLVDKRNYGKTTYSDPVAAAKKYAAILKQEKKCDYVICLSHLGYKYPDKKVSDDVLAGQVNNIDLIIGGHTHTFLDEPVLKTNSDNKPMYVTQVGWAGIWLGRIDVYFSNEKKKTASVASVTQIDQDSC
jgi:5'-nucleotidase